MFLVLNLSKKLSKTGVRSLPIVPRDHGCYFELKTTDDHTDLDTMQFRREERGNGEEAVFEEIMAESFPKLISVSSHRFRTL